MTQIGAEVAIDLRDLSHAATSVRQALNLSPHPEGGHYRELWRDPAEPGGRGAATSILFQLAAGERSHWHRVDAAEIWLWHGGAALELELYSAMAGKRVLRLGPNFSGGETLQAVVPKQTWQAARSSGAWSVVSCVVAPAFEFEGFELAPPDWEPS